MEEVVKIISEILSILISIFLSAFIVMCLWNYLMPMIFGLTTLNYLQTFCLMLLIKGLFSRDNLIDVKTNYTKKKGE